MEKGFERNGISHNYKKNKLFNHSHRGGEKTPLVLSDSVVNFISTTKKPENRTTLRLEDV
jgi:hypothetical protein